MLTCISRYHPTVSSYVTPAAAYLLITRLKILNPQLDLPYLHDCKLHTRFKSIIANASNDSGITVESISGLDTDEGARGYFVEQR